MPERSAAVPGDTPSGRHTETQIYDAILKALLSGALRAGTPLRERTLAETFGVTRGAVRKVLTRLGAEGKLDLKEGRGAYVPDPSDDDIRGVYLMRRVVESGCIAMLVRRLRPAMFERLEGLLAQERQAHRDGRREDAVRLAGEFHTTMVALLDNAELARTFAGLLTRTRMFVALHEPTTSTPNAIEEHDRILEALRERNVAAAASAMIHHLDCVEQRVLEHSRRGREPDLASVLRDALT